MSTELSIVSPLYRTSEHVVSLIGRLRATVQPLTASWELILVDDRCPERSGSIAAAQRLPGERVRVLSLDRNVGQLAAVNIALGEIDGDLVVVMDADLQDRPEDVAVLVDTLRNSNVDVVAAGRSGSYTSGGRHLTAKLFRRVRTILTRGRVPADAGLFLAARRAAIDRVLALDDPKLHPVSGLARVGATMISVPVERATRDGGGSGYSWWRRLRVAASALAAVTPMFPVVRALDRRRWSPPALIWLTEGGQVAEPIR